MIAHTPLFRIGEPDDEQTFVSAWCELANIGEIQVQSDEKPAFPLCGFPHGGIVSAAQSLVQHGVHVIAERNQAWRDRAR